MCRCYVARQRKGESVKHIVLLLILAAPALAQSPEYTGGLVNGRMWAKFADSDRLAFVLGLHDGLGVLSSIGRTEDQEAFRCACDFGEFTRGITEQYSWNTAYADVPIVVQMRVYARRSKGWSRLQAVAELTEYLHRLAEDRKISPK